MATLVKETETQTPRKTLSVFGAKPADAILVPEMPLAVRNNCQSGKWTIGDKEFGSDVSMTILKFSKYFGDLGQTTDTLWGQLWFIAESGELPRGTVMVTYIKSRSLNEFNTLVVTIQSRGVDPSTGIFTPKFVKHTGQKPDSNGVVKPVNYYSLDWSWEERKDWAVVDQAIAALDDPYNLMRMIDVEGTKAMTCLDDKSPNQVASIIRTNTPEFSGSNPASLPPANTELKQLHSATEF